MSTRVLIPGSILNKFRATFHHDYPYDFRYRWDNVILESSEGVRFHFDRQALIGDSTIFADASVLASNGDTLQPIVFTFAPTAGLHYFLMLPQQPSRPGNKPNEEPEPLTVTQGTTADTIQIAHVLDAPAVGRAILHQGRLDVCLRYAIERSFQNIKPTADDVKHPITRFRDPIDISFSLNLNDRYQRILQLLQEINPAAVKSLVEFHHHRQNALCAISQWWSTGIPVGRLLRSDLPPKIIHNQDCKGATSHGERFRPRVAEDRPRLYDCSGEVQVEGGENKECKENTGRSCEWMWGLFGCIESSVHAGVEKLQRKFPS
jgi:hypothetical protein